MESITGVRFACAPTQENISQCSEMSAVFLRALVEREGITYSQILYPYADALSLSGAAGTESTRIFGTHMLLRNVALERISHVMQSCFTAEVSRDKTERYETTEFSLTEGAVMSSDVAEFLSSQSGAGLHSAGDFCGMLGGYVTHWRIRECARIFASFCEMSYRRADGEITGLCGGRLILTPSCGCPEAAEAIFTRKTGVRL